MNTGGGQLSKTDSHAVLMELFARDQDLVRQATESARMKGNTRAPNNQSDGSNNQQGQAANNQNGQHQRQLSSQHPMKIPLSQMNIGSNQSLYSWPHFSSISSLNNLGTMPGVKSITSLSGFDLANQGNANKKGSLAQLKSMESMGKNDSYAFLEVFFGERSLNNMSSLNMSSVLSKDQKGTCMGMGVKREEDNDIGLSLEDDQSPSTVNPTTNTSTKHHGMSSNVSSESIGAVTPVPAPVPITTTSLTGGGSGATGKSSDSNTNGTLKRAYDDALAARGLMSVSRSSEKLTDLALPAKIQRTLSQEFIRHQPQQQQQGQHQQQGRPMQSQPQVFTPFSYNSASTSGPTAAAPTSSDAGKQNDTGASTTQQYPGQHPGQHPGEPLQYSKGGSNANNSNRSSSSGLGSTYLSDPMGPPKMQSSLLTIPTDEPTNSKKWVTPASSSQNQSLEGRISAV